MSSTNKKVQVLRFERESVSGYLNPKRMPAASEVELLGTDGALVRMPMGHVKAICFVKEFQNGDLLEQRSFASRPKLQGLWVRLTFRDGETMEGLLQNDLLQVSPHGFEITPPNVGANTQRLYVPREALDRVEVLGVVGGSRQTRAGKPERQIELFDGELS